MLRLQQCRDGLPPGKRGIGMERNSGLNPAQAWAVQGWVTPWEEGRRGEKNSRLKDAKAWGVQGWVTS